MSNRKEAEKRVEEKEKGDEEKLNDSEKRGIWTNREREKGGRRTQLEKEV